MKRIAFAALFSLLAAGAGAEPVKCIDAKGKTRYVDESMVGEQQCKPVKDAMSVVTPQQEPPAAATSSSSARRTSPRPKADTRLAEAEAKLAEAKNKLAEQEGIRVGGERNYARVQERLQPFQEAVERAQGEVEQLRREVR